MPPAIRHRSVCGLNFSNRITSVLVAAMISIQTPIATVPNTLAAIAIAPEAIIQGRCDCSVVEISQNQVKLVSADRQMILKVNENTQ